MGDVMDRFRRVVWIVLDSVGIGAMPDASDYGNEGSDTLGKLAYAPGARGGVNLGTRNTLADFGQTVAENFEVSIENGESFLSSMFSKKLIV